MDEAPETKPKLLLVEDDPTTRAFLSAAAEALPATVDAADSLAQARRRVRERDYDLWLIDAHLPDGEGAALLAELRAAGLQTPALAHTATRERQALEALTDAGFVAALCKPLSATMLRDAIRNALGSRRHRVRDGDDDGDGHDAAGISDAPLWDDDGALAALAGQRAHVDALRTLFLGELPAARDAVRCAAGDGDTAALQAALHRLQASCGFVGAARLQRAVAALRAAPRDAAALRDFLAATQDTLSSA